MTNELINLNKDSTIQLWMERVRACRASNLTVRAWCQQNDIPCSSYYHWQRNLFDNAVANAQAPVSQFAEISVSTTSITSKEVTSEVIASLEVNGITVQLYSNAKASSIAAICKGLRQC